eukprot:TRINITY_DN19616_c0_g4_i1.p1 TRINITY_DN19616_c0_g4~~TRINITY_DN19616_c0_g4_i1.p1  ORF type:complete len:747 (-),score=158.92 TRINITY_DN19616_c0_g4_i1:159-2303(-)
MAFRAAPPAVVGPSAPRTGPVRFVSAPAGSSRLLRSPPCAVDLAHGTLAVAATAVAAARVLQGQRRSVFLGRVPSLAGASVGQRQTSGLASLRRAAASVASGESTLDGPQKLAELRNVMAVAGIDALLIPTDDPHMSEVPPECFARRAFISNFTGSAGTALVTSGEALLWTDGRYFLQAEKQLPEGWSLMKTGVKGTPEIPEWLLGNLKAGQTVGMDAFVHPASFAIDLKSRLAKKGMSMKTLDDNLVDQVWATARPPAPPAPARVHPEKFAGLSVTEKLMKVRADMEKEGAQRLVVSTLDEVAYLFNLRGGDVHRTPFVMAYGLVDKTAATLFAGSSAQGGTAAKIPADVTVALQEAGVTVRPYDDVLTVLAEDVAPGKVWVDPQRTNYALFQAAGPNEQLLEKPSPLSMMKARKNESEMQGMRAAHRRDGAALARSFSKLEAMVGEGRHVTEVDVDTLVTGSRAASQGYLDNSFDTIAGYGAHGAIIHYRAEPDSCADIGTSAPLLVDSGAQYEDGTTDVTRTMHFGEPTSHQRECFTRVLKGHIGLATTVFPEGTPGFVVDAFARRSLWEAGLDYRHGTGHGVGAALAVHEGPMSISQRFNITTELDSGMIVSNEPGYYADGEFGIRIENLLVIVEKDTAHRFGDKRYLGFEPLTLVPIQRKFIDKELLNQEEVEYLNAYHSRVRDEIGPLLSPEADAEARAWLLRETEPM